MIYKWGGDFMGGNFLRREVFIGGNFFGGKFLEDGGVIFTRKSFQKGKYS